MNSVVGTKAGRVPANAVFMDPIGSPHLPISPG
jgi:hypothetical protein